MITALTSVFTNDFIGPSEVRFTANYFLKNKPEIKCDMVDNEYRTKSGSFSYRGVFALGAQGVRFGYSGLAYAMLR